MIFDEISSLVVIVTFLSYIAIILRPWFLSLMVSERKSMT